MEEHERAEAEDIIRAIRQGEVDAFVVREAAEERIYSLRSADVLYRAMIEEMKDGAVALDASGLIVYCNAYFAQLMKGERAAIIGTKIFPFAPGDADDFFAALREQARNGTSRREIELRATDGTMVPVLAAMNRIRLDADNEVYCSDRHRSARAEAAGRAARGGAPQGRVPGDAGARAAQSRSRRFAMPPSAWASGQPTPERLQWARNVIERQVDQLTRLVDDLLDVSRISRGKVRLDTGAGGRRRGRVPRPRYGPAADRGAQAGPEADPAGRAAACQGRRDATRPGGLEPAQQRRQVHAGARADHGQHRGGGGRRRTGGAGFASR